MIPETNQRFAETTNTLTAVAPKTVVNADKAVEPEGKNILHCGATSRITYAFCATKQTTAYPDHKDSLEFNSIDSPVDGGEEHVGGELAFRLRCCDGHRFSPVTRRGILDAAAQLR
jgi:hypothetical protein